MIKIPNTIDEIVKLPPTVAIDVMRCLLDITGETECAKRLKPVDFDYFFGGTPCIVETFEDLKSIDTLVYNLTAERWSNITESPGDFDIAEKLSDDWLFFLLCTNNAGGIGYYVPAAFIKSCPNLLKSIKQNE